MTRTSSPFKFSDRAFFGIALATNALLSFVPLPVFEKTFLFAGGLLLAGFGLCRLAGQRSSWDLGKSIRLSPWLLALAASFGIFLRFFKLTSFRPWPNSDEALQGFFAIDLVRQWDWRFFYTSGQHPPLLIWLLHWFFQGSAPPLFNLWFLSALLSTLFVILGFLAARMFFPPPIPSLYGLLLTFGFWPLYFGRFCVQGVLVPFFEMAAFGLVGYFLRSKSDISKGFAAAGLGLVAGVGTWTYTSWLAVVLFLAALSAWRLRRNPREMKFFLLFVLFLCAGSLPWIVAAFEEKFGGYAVGVSLLGGYFNWKDQFLTSLSYITDLFWGTLKEPVSYGPVLGGMLNPLLGAFFFLGALKLFRHRTTVPAKAMGLAAVLFLLPGVLSADHVEMFRIIQFMPLLFLAAALGFASFLEFWPKRRRPVVLAFFLGLSLLYDGYHLVKPVLQEPLVFPPRFQDRSNDENYWAYQWLKPEARKLGPGLIFTDFSLLSHNHTLNVMTYPFNALSNPTLDAAHAKWAAVVTNIHYAPFLSRRFPGFQWHPVSPFPVEDGGSVVGLIPVNAENREVFSDWARVHLYFHRLGIEAENLMNDPVRYRETVQELPEGYALLQGDPFLESCYGEWMAQYHESSRLDWNIRALQRAIQKGYPAANLYYKLGSFYYWNREPERAKRAYLMAAGCRPNYTNAKEVLARLWGGGK